MISIEDGEDVPDLSPERLRLWLDMHSDISSRIVDAHLADRDTSDRTEIKWAMLQAWRARLAQHGLDDREAWLHVRDLVDRVMCQPKDRPVYSMEATHLGCAAVRDALFAERVLAAIPADQAETIRAKFAALGIPVVARCGSCDRILEQPSDPLSGSSRGECGACVLKHHLGIEPPDLPPDELRAFLAPILDKDRELREMIDTALARAGLDIHSDPQERMVVICMQRLIQQGMDEAQARVKAIEVLSQPWPADWPPLPKFDEL